MIILNLVIILLLLTILYKSGKPTGCGGDCECIKNQVDEIILEVEKELAEIDSENKKNERSEPEDEVSVSVEKPAPKTTKKETKRTTKKSK